MRPKEKIFTVRYQYLIIGVVILSIGCINVYTTRSFPVEQIQSIRLGTTTKQEILNWFGPPVSMARKGQSIHIPDITNGDGEPQDIAVTDILKYFSIRHEEANLVIYLYQYWMSDIPSMFAVYAPAAEGQKTVRQLWVLLDEDRNIVVDTVQREKKPGVI